MLARWYAVHTRSRAEKQIAMRLSSKQVESFLPTYLVASKGSKRELFEAPLFTGYLFARISPNQSLLVLETPGVVSLLGFGSAPHPVPDAEIENLRRMVKELVIEPHPLLVVGMKVRVLRGPLEGLEGILERKKGNFHLVITVNAIMRSFSVEVAVNDVEPLRGVDSARKEIGHSLESRHPASVWEANSIRSIGT